ncbi:MAG: hypothetical protein AUK47_20940 [Deltaproteobacteria bacterium CG2_30_63_29]|nr:MAG: hypothetical protein AUK47_20940 [Deltaproteobacteria bacterium CG2_30_63_29]
MGTWAGAIVETRQHPDVGAVLAKHGITVIGEVTPWVLVQVDVGFGSLTVPAFVEPLSRELRARVIGFFIQSTASVEELEHWDSGERLRKLEFFAEEGGWRTEGDAQEWETAYFFAEGEALEPDAWPHNLRDELTDEELARYQTARAANDATAILDLLSGGSVWSVRQLCRRFEVDPAKPGGVCTARRSLNPWLIGALIVFFLAGLFLLGVYT